MTGNADWELGIMNDPDDNRKLVVEVLYKDEPIILIRKKGNALVVTGYKEDIDVPFDILYQAMQEAKEGIEWD